MDEPDRGDARGTLLSALAQIAAALATGDVPSEVLGGVLDRIASTVRATGVSLWLVENHRLECRARVGEQPPAVSTVRRLIGASDLKAPAALFP